MKLKLGISSCPNDTFAFEALINKKIDTHGIDFDLIIADVEQLNKMTMSNELDIAKISFHTFMYVADKYKILNSGSALGKNNGPLLVSKRKIYPDEIVHLNIAVPGYHTTAFLLLKIFFGEIKQTKELLFSEIPYAVVEDQFDAGLIIHETRFTYEKLGLRLIADLGQLWEQKHNMPLPLGGIVINKNIDEEIQKKFDKILQSSIRLALQNPQETYNFVRQFAQEISPEVMFNHIKLYVNEFTIELTDIGKKAILFLLNQAQQSNFINQFDENIFV